MSDFEPIPQSTLNQERPSTSLSSINNETKIPPPQPTASIETTDEEACKALIKQIQNAKQPNENKQEEEMPQDISEKLVMINNEARSKSIFSRMKNSFISFFRFFKKIVWS